MGIPRIRVHRDGWAVEVRPGRWLLHDDDGVMDVRVDEADVTGPDWSSAVVLVTPSPDEVTGDVARFGGFTVSTGVDPGMTEAWRRRASKAAAIAEWGERR